MGASLRRPLGSLALHRVRETILTHTKDSLVIVLAPLDTAAPILALLQPWVQLGFETPGSPILASLDC